MERDVTPLIQRYRLALRHIWNCYIWPEAGVRGDSAMASFGELKNPLFQAVVAEFLDQNMDKALGAEFRVRPDPTLYQGAFSSLRVDTQRPSTPQTVQLGADLGSIRDSEIHLVPVDFYDHQPLGYIDFRYCLALVVSCTKYPEIAGQHAIVEVEESCFYWDEALADPAS